MAGPAQRYRKVVIGLRVAFLCALLGLVALRLFSSVGDIKYAAGSDEGYYLRYTQSVATEGLAGLRTNFDQYLGDRSQWMFPNPFRMGFYGAAALWSSAFGATFESLSQLSIASHLALIALVFAFCLRHFGPGKSELITIAVAFSPLLLGLGQRALLDSFATLTAALALFTFVDAIAAQSQARRQARRWAAFGVAFTFAILVKETTVLLLVPFAIYAWLRRAESLAAFVPLIAAPVLCGLAYVLAAGGLDPVLELIRIILDSPDTNRYAQRFGAGPWYRYIIDFLMMSPWPVLLAVASFGIIALRARDGSLEPAAAFFALVLVTLVAEYALFTKNLRYVALLEVPMRALAVWALFAFVHTRHWARTLAICTLLVLLNAWWDAQTFEGFFVDRKVYDPVSRLLLRFREFIPR